TRCLSDWSSDVCSSDLLAGTAILFGVALATAMIAIAVDIGDKINHELSSYGANILLTPEDTAREVKVGGVSLKPVTSSAYIKESELPKLKGIFWGHNIIGYSPILPGSINVQGKSIEVLGTYFDHPVTFGREIIRTGVRT